MRALPLTAALLVATCGAQIHTRDPLVRGQPAELRFENVPATSVGILGVGFGGVGSGACLPLPFGFCLDLLDPILWSDAIFSNATGSAVLPVVIGATSALLPIATQAIWVDISQNPNTFLITNSIDGSIETLAAFNQAFDSDTLDDAWMTSQPGLFSSQLTGAQLEMIPTGTGPGFAWADDSEGGWIYREVFGNFSICCNLTTLDPLAPSAPPQPTRRIGGLILRSPTSAPGQRDWIAVGLGSGTLSTPHAITAIDTLGATSSYQEFNQMSQPNELQAELRLRRIGDTIFCDYRNLSTLPFSTVATIVRPGFPNPIQAGMFCSAESGPVGMVTLLDHVRFQNQ